MAASTSLGLTVISCLRCQNYLSSCWQVIGPPICQTRCDVTLKPRSHPDGTHARLVSALDIDLGVTNQKRTGSIDLVVSRGVQDHPGRGLAVRRMLAGN